MELAKLMTINKRNLTKNLRKFQSSNSFSQAMSKNSTNRTTQSSSTSSCLTPMHIMPFGMKKSLSTVHLELSNHFNEPRELSLHSQSTRSIFSQQKLTNSHLDRYYSKVFIKPLKKKKSKPLIDNKLNILNLQNEVQYKNYIKKRNDIKVLKGKFVHEGPEGHFTLMKQELNSLREKISFLKGVIDYTYPLIVVEKNRRPEKIQYDNQTPLEKDIQKNIKEKKKKRYILKSCILTKKVI